jgi:uncharacterized protein (DUF924 family)
MKQDNQSVEGVPDQRIGALIDFWFGPQSGGFSGAPAGRRWFATDPEFDREISDRFGSLLKAAADGALAKWLDDPHGRLAFIIVTDQFSRQIHRGLADAFATDASALAAARDGIELGHDRRLGFDERAFFYLPFEHSESVQDQHRSVELFTRLAQETPAHNRGHSDEALRFARGHRDIVLRFGRFPHRNASLGRASTPAELTFLRNASRFGQ